MKTLIIIAWRNIWRNKRRTLITAASVLFAVFLSSFMVSIQTGAWDKMVDNMVQYYYGYAQVHQEGYWEDRSLDNAFNLEEAKAQLPNPLIQQIELVPRIESFALASSGDLTMGVMVVGTDPVAENSMTELQERVVKGDYFKDGEPSALLAEGVAEKLKLGVGDTLILISQGYHGTNAAGKYAVKGITRFGSPELNKQMVFLPLQEAQFFYRAESLVTSLAINMDRSDLEPTVKTLKTNLNEEEYEVMAWEELLPALVEAKEVDAASNYIVLLILYVIIAFGIFGTILMMTKERQYEFGVLTAIGMSRGRLAITTWLEIFFLGMIGAIAGILVSFPLVYYFHINPIDMSAMQQGMDDVYEKFGMEPIIPAAFKISIFLGNAFTVFIITTLLSIYPIINIFRLKPVEAMRA